MNAPFEKKMFGEYGFIYESGTTAQVGPFYRIDAVTTATFAAISTPQIGAASDAITGVAFAPPFRLDTVINSFTLTSGSVIAYKLPVNNP